MLMSDITVFHSHISSRCDSKSEIFQPDSGKGMKTSDLYWKVHLNDTWIHILSFFEGRLFQKRRSAWIALQMHVYASLIQKCFFPPGREYLPLRRTDSFLREVTRIIYIYISSFKGSFLKENVCFFWVQRQSYKRSSYLRKILNTRKYSPVKVASLQKNGRKNCRPVRFLSL